MKKLIFTFIAVVAFSFASTAQCNAQSTPVTTDCGTTCLSVQIPFTGIVAVDTANFIDSEGTMKRKPTYREALMFAAASC